MRALLVLVSLVLAGVAEAASVQHHHAIVARLRADTGPDVTAPTIESASIDGDALTVVFSEAVSQGTGYDDGDWDLDMSTTGSDIALTYVSGDGTATWTFTAASAAVEGETVDLDYAGTADGVEDNAGNDLAAVSSFSVTNNTAAGYTAGTAVFDGSNDYMTYAGLPTGMSDSILMTLSFWLKPAADGSQYYIYANGALASPRFHVFRSGATSQIAVGGFNISATLILDIGSVAPVPADGNWHHVLVAINMTNSARIWIDGVESVVNVSTFNTEGGSLDTATTRYRIGGTVGNTPTNLLNGALAELWVDDSLVTDPTKFRDAVTGKPIDLGSDGSGPTGSAPAIYLRGAGDGFAVNSGTGENFTVTGALGETTPP